LILIKTEFCSSVSLEFYPFKVKVNTLGDIFEVSVRITKHEIEKDIAGAEVYISFDSTFFQVVDENGDDIPGYGSLPLIGIENFPIILTNFVDNNSGMIRYAAGTYQGKTAPVTLIKIRFRTLKKGQSNILFQRAISKVLIGLAKGETIREVTLDNTYGFTDCVVGVETSPVTYAGTGPFNPKKGDLFKVVYSYTPEIISVILKIYTVTGRLVRTVTSFDVSSSFIEWDGKDESGNFVKNGVYIYQLIFNTTRGKIYQRPKMVGVFK
jgi:hypothetical protein